MKKTFVFALILVHGFSISFAQAIRRVNTNPSVTGTNVYQTLQAAHDAATSGDIIIIEASSISCGNLVATKSLKIYGKGYFTGANAELHISPDPSLAGSITFNQGSSNSEISGVTCSDLLIKGASNIRVYRNHVTNTVTIDAQNVAGTDIAISNIQIAQCFIEAYIYVYSTTQGVSTCTITNNHFNFLTNSSTNISSLIVNNNVIEAYVTLYNATFQNNILYNTGASSTFPGCTITNNIARGNETDLSAGTANQINFDLNNATNGFLVTIGAALPAGISEDERWQLQPGSSLKTAGTSGSEVGMYGGLNPYVPSGIPGAPSIFKLLTPDYGNTAAPLPVTISVKSNN